MDRTRQTYALFSTLGWFYDLTIRLTVFVFCLLLIHLFVFTVRQVDGTSMLPTFRPGDYVLVNRLERYRGQFERGDILAYRFPGEVSVTALKRVIGLPGETVHIVDGQVEINGVRVQVLPTLPPSVQSLPVQLGADDYFVIGDNPEDSLDSRSFGGVSRSLIVGRVTGTFTIGTILRLVREAFGAF